MALGCGSSSGQTVLGLQLTALDLTTATRWGAFALVRPRLQRGPTWAQAIILDRLRRRPLDAPRVSQYGGGCHDEPARPHAHATLAGSA